MGKEIDDYIKEGIYGTPETKPDERRKYLGTIRERVIVALTHKQVRESGRNKNELLKIIREHPKAKMFLNGNIEYRALSPYIKVAKEQHIPYSLTMNGDYNSDIGLLLAYDDAIDKEDIRLPVSEEKDEETHEESGIRKLFDQWF